ncbi:hypothetical protein HMPREF9946_03243 [Acetobacteraceae bacterium AT-5844]|nr:hypothetical protein HMPREF9946_03243 [Acetobacteraceae bacterium AT-5844]
MAEAGGTNRFLHTPLRRPGSIQQRRWLLQAGRRGRFTCRPRDGELGGHRQRHDGGAQHAWLPDGSLP